MTEYTQQSILRFARHQATLERRMSRLLTVTFIPWLATWSSKQ